MATVGGENPVRIMKTKMKQTAKNSRSARRQLGERRRVRKEKGDGLSGQVGREAAGSGRGFFYQMHECHCAPEVEAGETRVYGGCQGGGGSRRLPRLPPPDAAEKADKDFLSLICVV